MCAELRALQPCRAGFMGLHHIRGGPGSYLGVTSSSGGRQGMVQPGPAYEPEQGSQQPAPRPAEGAEFERLGDQEPLLGAWLHRLPGQLLAALLLVAGGMLVQHSPGRVPAPLMGGVAWVLHADTDPSHLTRRVGAWVARHGGVGPALQAAAANLNRRLRMLAHSADQVPRPPSSRPPYPAPGQQVAGGQLLGRIPAGRSRLHYEVLHDESESSVARTPVPLMPAGRGA